jgi:hypothetical protein
MFTENELRLLARCCNRELKFLRDVEEVGIATVADQHQVAALRANCVFLADEAKKAEAAKSKAE